MTKAVKKSEVQVPEVVAEEKLDAELVDKTVDWIREKVAETFSRGLLEIGTHIFEKFFDGEIEQVRSTNPKKKASFQSLAERCAKDPWIKLSKPSLHRAVSIAAVVKRLPPSAKYFQQLSPSHQAAFASDP